MTSMPLIPHSKRRYPEIRQGNLASKSKRKSVLPRVTCPGENPRGITRNHLRRPNEATLEPLYESDAATGLGELFDRLR